MTPGLDPTRADKTSAWQAVEDDAPCTPRGSGSLSQDPRKAPPSCILRAHFSIEKRREGGNLNSLCCPAAVGTGTRQPRGGTPQCQLKGGRY